MKRQIRRNVFETNSSSIHSLTICSEEEFEAWQKEEALFNDAERNFIFMTELSESNKKMAEMQYEKDKDDFQKDWADLSDKAKQKYYLKYAKRNNIINDDARTYKDYIEDADYDDLSVFEYRYTSKSGDRIVVFGECRNNN